MMVPRNRLLAGYACIIIPLIAVSALFPEAALACYVLAAFSGAICLGDALVSLPACRGVEVVFPDKVRMSRYWETNITIIVRNTHSRTGALKLGVLLSRKWFQTSYTRHIQLEGSRETGFEWPVTGIKQGRVVLDRCYLEMASKLGFWAMRKVIDIHCEFRIYPDLLSEKKSLAALFHRPGMGVHAMKQLGKGKEFEKLREYMPGDNYEDIHWKATARMGIPVAKIFQLERTQNIYVLIDNSRMSARKSGGASRETILESYIRAALAIGMATRRMGDHFGLGVFSDTLEAFLPAKNGKTHFSACRDLLFTLSHHPVTPDFTELVTFAGNKIRSRSLLIILTSLDDPSLAGGFLKDIHILSRRHLVLVNMLKPAHADPVFHSAGVQSVNDIYVDLAGHMIWQTLRELEQSLRKMGIGFCLSNERDLSFDLISRYIRIKQRQAL